ncbi:threonine aldolase family protein [Peptostreptococcus canis]|uniref:Low specificity L-threonine aldolase n=1 Tax=Peptostreptococcus canis TaxID=1159213 RepID=A0ABR6TKL3_9FIRM|nr:beta-eliminating lyase-related protein [Peptostreptococcus canis]MBC2575724.1 low specificity L-threonine aldolase [Peptostreptococcus canis]MBP1998161.1 threonine aldolase [Peptostreptococcus canis]
MLRFENDYSEGCFQEILDEFIKTNMEQTPGYRLDKYCEDAANKIKKACHSENIDVHFLVGGTQANMTVLDAILRPHQGVISPLLGHINVHEAGAIEGRGHKVIAISSGKKLDEEAKLSSESLDLYLTDFFNIGDWHKAQPGAVYISQPTERGALYTKNELIAIKSVCNKFNLPLYLDGARLSYALACDENDVQLEDLAKYTDIFYIGGTKCGAMFGEAICFCNEKFNRDFHCIAKHNGAVIAKGRLLGIQFGVLFSNDLYVDKSRDAYKFAIRIKKAFERKGINFISNSYTNQQFPILTKSQQELIRNNDISFNIECSIDEEKDATRFCTNWATKEEAIKKLEKIISNL